MAYLSQVQLESLGFKKLGKKVKISEKASIYNHDAIEIGDHSRIDDFCVISGKVVIGNFCHITPMCLVAGGEPGIEISDFCSLAYGVKVFSQTDDYSGLTMTNSTIYKKYKKEYFGRISLGRHVIVGAGSTILPGVQVGEGCSIGAMTLLNETTMPWGVYVGIPARRIKERSKQLLSLENEFISELKNDCSF